MLVYGRANGINVCVPAGNFFVSDDIDINGGVTLYGLGESSIISYPTGFGINLGNCFSYAGGGDQCATLTQAITGTVAVRGDGARLTNLKVRCTNCTSRTGEGGIQVYGGQWYSGSTPSSCAGTGCPSTNWEISYVWVGDPSTGQSASGGTGIYSENGAHGKIHDNYVYKSQADCIHNVDGSNNIDIYNNTLDTCGDDGISVVSEVSDPMGISHDFNIHGNHLISQTNGRGYTSVGGNNITFSNNRADMTWGAGFYVVSESSYDTYGCNTVNIIDNTITHADAGNVGVHGSAYISGDNGTSYPVVNVTMTGNHISDDYNLGVYVGANVSGFTHSGNTVNGAAY